jgi:hypothetical protein
MKNTQKRVEVPIPVDMVKSEFLGIQTLRITVPITKNRSKELIKADIAKIFASIELPAEFKRSYLIRSVWWTKKQYVSEWEFLGSDIKNPIGTASVIGHIFQKYGDSYAIYIR